MTYILQIPEGVKKIQLTNAIVWFDNGILYSAPSRGPYINQSREEMEKEFLKLKEFTQHKKVKLIAESHPKAESPKKADRDYISEQFEEIISALAVVTPNALSRMVTNLLFLAKPPSFPTQLFVSVSDAKKWLAEINNK